MLLKCASAPDRHAVKTLPDMEAGTTQQAWGVPYAFSGQTLFANEPVPQALQPYLDWAKQRRPKMNGILVN